MRLVTVAMGVLVVLVGTAGPGTAADEQPPCLADVERLCGRVPPTGEFVQSCLEGQRDQLSARCRKHVGTLTRDTGTLTTACQSDLAKLCGDLPIAAGAHQSCLLAHRDQLSERCRTTLDEQTRDE